MADEKPKTKLGELIANEVSRATGPDWSLSGTPAAKVLDLINRPVEAFQGTQLAALEDRSQGDAAVKGLKGEQTTGAQLIKAALIKAFGEGTTKKLFDVSASIQKKLDDFEQEHPVINAVANPQTLISPAALGPLSISPGMSQLNEKFVGAIGGGNPHNPITNASAAVELLDDPYMIAGGVVKGAGAIGRGTSLGKDMRGFAVIREGKKAKLPKVSLPEEIAKVEPVSQEVKAAVVEPKNEAAPAMATPEIVDPAPIVKADPKTKINMNRFSEFSKSDKKEIGKGFQAAAPDTQFQKRGVRSFDVTKQSAASLSNDDAFWGKVESLKPGEVLNAEESLALDNHLTGIAKERRKAWARYSAKPTEETLSALNDITSRQLKYSMVSESIAAEQGRALGARRIKVNPKDSIIRMAGKLAKDLPPEQQASLQTKLAAIPPDDINGQAKVLREHMKSGWVDKIVEFTNAGLLWQPTTHIVNTASNLMTFLWQPLEKSVSAGVDLIRAALTRTPRQRFFGDAGAFVKGGVTNVGEGFKNFARAVADETFSSGPTKGQEVLQKGPAIKGKFGEAVRIPFRLLSAEDEFVRTMNRGGELRVQANRQAAGEGLKGSAKKQRIGEIVKNPGDDIAKTAEENAAENIFQQDYPTTPSGKPGFWATINRARTGDPTGILRIVIPFFKTPLNLTFYAARRSPLGLASPYQWRKILKGGGQASDAIGQIAAGTTLAATLTALAYKGYITGAGPKNKNEKAALLQTGWQPYSVKIGDKYYSYQRADPWSKSLQWASNIANATRNSGKIPGDEVAAEFSVDMAKSVLDQTYMTGLRELLDAFADPERAGPRLVQSLATRPIPSFLRYAANLMDNKVRDPEGIGQAVRVVIPGLNKVDNKAVNAVLGPPAPPMRDRFGDPIVRQGSVLNRAFNPYKISETSKDPAVQELASLRMDFGPPSDKIVGEKLGQQLYDSYQKLSGKLLHAAILQRIKDPSYSSMSKIEKISAIEQIKKDIRDQVMKDVIRPAYIIQELKKLKGKSPEEIAKKANEINVMFGGTAQEREQLQQESDYERY